MMAQGSTYWIVLALVAAMYVIMCIRVARRMVHIGRSGVAWFFISLFLTSIPAARALRRHYRQARSADRANRRAAGRCRHCGAVLGESTTDSEPAVCPQCGMKLTEETLA